jgi:hypothetical protein
MSKLTNNTTSLQGILEKIKKLPPQGDGIFLPELSTPGSETDILSGKELFDQEGNIVVGTIPSQEGRTIIPTREEQIAINAATYASGTITVAAIPEEYKKITARIQNGVLVVASED